MRPNETTYVTATHVRQHYDVSRSTLRRWAATRGLRTLNNGTRWRYSLIDIQRLVGVNNDRYTATPQKARIAYARVSSEHQRHDLERQLDDLHHAFPDHELISDVGSGLNWHRSGFLSILDRVLAGMVEEVVVAHRDRLCRVAIELVEWLFVRAGCRLVVHYSSSDDSNESGSSTTTTELADDLLSIVTVFVARHNGMRSAENRRRRRLQGNEEAAKVRKIRMFPIFKEAETLQH